MNKNDNLSQKKADNTAKNDDDDVDFALIENAQKTFFENSNRLFEEGIDFVKWTTTVCLAAMLFVATSMSSATPNKTGLLGFSFVFFSSSIVCAMTLVYFVLSYRAAQMNSSSAHLALLCSQDKKFRLLCNLPDSAPFEKQLILCESQKRMRIFRNPSTFGLIILAHVFFIMLGLTFLILSLSIQP